MVAVWTRVRLSQWGRFCRGRPVTGYPTAAAFTRANSGGRANGEGGEMPQELEEIDRAVAMLRQELRQAAIAGYVWGGPWAQRAQRLALSPSTLRRHLARAEAQIERALNLPDRVR